MIRKRITTPCKLLALAVFLFIVLFSSDEWGISAGVVGLMLRETESIAHDPGTQWMVAICLLVYLAVFSIIEWASAGTAEERRHRSNALDVWDGHAIVWLLASVLLALVPYALAYRTGAGSVAFLVLLAGVVLGSGGVVWTQAKVARVENDLRIQWLVGILAFLLTGAALWHGNLAQDFDYHNMSRWNGPWDNPNIYGMLMGVGLVLEIGQIVQSSSSKVQSRDVQGPSAFVQLWRDERSKFQSLFILFWSVAAVVCGIGLFKSYSRGAWVGALVGIGYLFWFQVQRSRFKVERQLNAGCGGRRAESARREGGSEPRNTQNTRKGFVFVRVHLWARRNWIPLLAITVSVAVTAFWQFRFTEWRPARRLFSIANVNDFSWRNRVTAWEGALRMMTHRPWFGYGWGQAEKDYEQEYRPPNLDNGAAIQMNDYFMLGISAGVPALVCFLVYIRLALRNPQSLGPGVPTLDWTRATCRAGAIVLLVGFWFDGGLFKLATGSVFWILLGLGRVKPIRTDEGPVALPERRAESEFGVPMRSGAQGTDAPCLPQRLNVWLRRVAWVLAIAAFLQTVVLVGTPFLGVNSGTLAIARRWLVPPRATEDLNFLAAEPVCQAQKLRVLIQHTSLANYNRQLINWKLDDPIYRDYVLIPTISPARDGQLCWRRSLWEYFYPPIRKENKPESAAEIVMKYLRRRLTIVEKGPLTIDEIWIQKRADAEGFEALKVATFRSVGIPARLNDNGYAEIFMEGKWKPEP